jgi:hypothetical protein
MIFARKPCTSPLLQMVNGKSSELRTCILVMANHDRLPVRNSRRSSGEHQIYYRDARGRASGGCGKCVFASTELMCNHI